MKYSTVAEESRTTFGVLFPRPRHERSIKFRHAADDDVQDYLERQDGFHWHSWPSLSVHNKSESGRVGAVWIASSGCRGVSSECGRECDVDGAGDKRVTCAVRPRQASLNERA